MTVKERILATLQGKPTDVLPFVPRLDNWFYAQQAADTLPKQYRHANLREFTDDLGLGYHSIVPNFRGWRKGGDKDLHVGLGLYDLELSPWTVKFHNVKITQERSKDGELQVIYETPKGNLQTKVVYTEKMQEEGITLYAHKEHALKSVEDYEALAYLLENAEVLENYEAFTAYQEQYVGERGIAVALSAMWASAGHYLIKELMSFEDFYLARFDDKQAMDDLVMRITPFCEKLFEKAVQSPAEVILSGANYDLYFTTPDVIADYVVPVLKKQSDKAHQMGKFLATHTDGENTKLLEQYVAAGFDIADSICPAPLTKLTLKETRDVFQDKITIWGGIPSVAMVPTCTTERQFCEIVEETLASIGAGDHIILSVADTLPPAADFDRLLYLKNKIEEFGPVNPKGNHF